MLHEQVFRESLIDVLRRELVGPEWAVNGPDGPAIQPTEILHESPVQRYSAGVLFPMRQPICEVEDTDEPVTLDSEDVSPPEPESQNPNSDADRIERGDDRLGDAYDETVRLANEFFPSAIGLSFIASMPAEGLQIDAKAAVYRSQVPSDPKTKLREWHRTALALAPVYLKIPASAENDLQEFTLVEGLLLRAISHRRRDGNHLVTVSLLNTKLAAGDKMPSGADCFFQVGFEVAAADGSFAFQEYRSASRSLGDPEEAALELLYRNRRAYAAGHGCSGDWSHEQDGCTNRVKTVSVPAVKVAPVEARIQGGNELSMFFLSGAEGEVSAQRVPDALEALAQDYEAWIAAQEVAAESLPDRLKPAAATNLKACHNCLARIRAGIDCLRSDVKMLDAFMLANRAMLMQQQHSSRLKRQLNQTWVDLPASYRPDGDSGRWRSFQLAFIVMNLCSLSRRRDKADHDERDLVDLIWFPTGGGKTEAYLGLAATDIFYRRLTDPKDSGCTVLMRYTLRLLTSQQFQRASSMICACEVIRRERPGRDLGHVPISIGLWVGESLTPIRNADAVKAVNDLADRSKVSQNPFQLLRCPWCGTELDDRDKLGYVPHGKPKTVAFICPEPRCAFSSRDTRLPVVVVDEDIYETPPTLLIGTVDKFAMLAWREEAGSIFGLRGGQSVNPPDLIIQDELHLISGPLGSVVGLYESVIDLLCSQKGRRPKIVASTATIRRASQQCLALYDRPTFQFPPQGTDISDSFFAVENPMAAGRVYTGVFATAAPSFVTAQIRAVSALLQGCLTTPLPAGASESVRDPYWTVLQYFNSLRELGHAATLIEADIPEYMWAIASRDKIPKELCRRLGSPVELTSRLAADEIPEILDKLFVSYPRQLDDGPRPLDTLLATNMISVGVDVNRLGLMVVVGQPKTTSEYIQASSRVGRSARAPGLVVTMLNPGKPRDRSHYEHFRAFHSAFYRFVEPTSVTPFSIPVLERALHAILIVISRHVDGLQTPDRINLKSKTLDELKQYLEARCKRSDADHAEALVRKLSELLSHWSEVRPAIWGRFGMPPESRPLMYPAGTEPPPDWDDSAWATPSSMRNVDVECQARLVTMYPDPN